MQRLFTAILFAACICGLIGCKSGSGKSDRQVQMPTELVASYASSYIQNAERCRLNTQKSADVQHVRGTLQALETKYSELLAKQTGDANLEPNEKEQLETQLKERYVQIVSQRHKLQQLENSVPPAPEDPHSYNRGTYLHYRFYPVKWDKQPEMAAEREYVKSLTTHEQHRAQLDASKFRYEAVFAEVSGTSDRYYECDEVIKAAEKAARDAWTVHSDAQAIADKTGSTIALDAARDAFNRKLAADKKVQEAHQAKEAATRALEEGKTKYFRAFHAVLDTPTVTPK